MSPGIWRVESRAIGRHVIEGRENAVDVAKPSSVALYALARSARIIVMVTPRFPARGRWATKTGHRQHFVERNVGQTMGLTNSFISNQIIAQNPWRREPDCGPTISVLSQSNGTGNQISNYLTCMSFRQAPSYLCPIWRAGKEPKMRETSVNQSELEAT